MNGPVDTKNWGDPNTARWWLSALEWMERSGSFGPVLVSGESGEGQNIQEWRTEGLWQDPNTTKENT